MTRNFAAEEQAEYEQFCKDLAEGNAALFKQFRKAQKWTQKDAAAAFDVSVQTIHNWEKKGNYGDFVYRQIFESDWGQAQFNPQWPKKFEPCGVGYTFEERYILNTRPAGRA
jgi:DNA-binding XRE family transcriptional regulator